MADLSVFDSLSSDEPVGMKVEGPDGTPLIDEETKEPVTIFLIGADSPDYQKASRITLNKRLKSSIKKQQIQLTADEVFDEQLMLVVRCTKGWKHVVVAGEQLTFSESKAKELYTRFPFIREQADRFIADRGNFLGNL